MEREFLSKTDLKPRAYKLAKGKKFERNLNG
jgi:hypothetical protein